MKGVRSALPSGLVCYGVLIHLIDHHLVSSMSTPADLAQRLYESLTDREKRVVFAESCTGGMVASEMTKISGVSDVFCGSAVTYRCDTKLQWLGVDGETLEMLTAVSAPIAHQMAQGTLKQTPEADFAVSITGHLGPNAPEGFDGLVFVGTARRIKGKVIVKVHQHHLETTGRANRLAEASACVLQAAMDVAASD